MNDDFMMNELKGHHQLEAILHYNISIAPIMSTNYLRLFLKILVNIATCGGNLQDEHMVPLEELLKKYETNLETVSLCYSILIIQNLLVNLWFVCHLSKYFNWRCSAKLGME